MERISTSAKVDFGPSRLARVAQIAASERIAETAAMQEPRPPEAVSVLRDLHVARLALLGAHAGGGDGVSHAVAAYNRASRLLNTVAESGPILPQLRG